MCISVLLVLGVMLYCDVTSITVILCDGTYKLSICLILQSHQFSYGVLLKQCVTTNIDPKLVNFLEILNICIALEIAISIIHY